MNADAPPGQPVLQRGIVTPVKAFLTTFLAPITTVIKQHPVLTYYALAFGISWGGVLLVIALGRGSMPATPKQFERLLPVAILALLAGPSVASVLLTALLDGLAGLRDLLVRLLRWRVGVRWYAVALLTAPLVMTAVLLTLSLTSPIFLPGIITSGDKTTRVLVGLATGLAAGIFEEMGWTGFAIPRLRRRYDVLTTGLIVGILWAVWHLIVVYWASGTVSGPLALASYLLDPFLFLVGFRVLMVWVYNRTGSLLVAMLMHASLTATTRIISPLSIAGGPLIASDLFWAAAVWLVVTAVAAANAGQFSRQPLQMLQRWMA